MAKKAQELTVDDVAAAIAEAEEYAAKVPKNKTDLPWPEELKAVFVTLRKKGMSFQYIEEFLRTWRGGKYRRCRTTLSVYAERNSL